MTSHELLPILQWVGHIGLALADLTMAGILLTLSKRTRRARALKFHPNTDCPGHTTGMPSADCLKNLR